MTELQVVIAFVIAVPFIAVAVVLPWLGAKKTQPPREDVRAEEGSR